MNQPELKMTLDDYMIKLNIPYYAADPIWREIFDYLANLSEEDRAVMLQEVDEKFGQLSGRALMFIRCVVKKPALPRMLVKAIDYENLKQLSRIPCGEGQLFQGDKALG